VDFDAVSSFEVINHVSSGFLISVIEDVFFWVHIPLDLMNFVGSVRTILSHDDGSFEFSVDEICIMSHSSITY